jgi:hypothetical protein
MQGKKATRSRSGPEKDGQLAPGEKKRQIRVFGNHQVVTMVYPMVLLIPIETTYDGLDVAKARSLQVPMGHSL